jgi:hypothetical protein
MIAGDEDISAGSHCRGQNLQVIGIAHGGGGGAGDASSPAPAQTFFVRTSPPLLC